MPYKDPIKRLVKRREWDKKYREEHGDERNAYLKEYRTSHKDELIVSGRHGVRHYQKLKMAELQNWQCAICGVHIDEPGKFDVDHNHITKQVRELLCGSCNRMLGHARESSTIMRKAIRYLEKHNGYHEELDVFVEDVP